MSTMTLSAKRQVVLPSELCRQVALAPGARVRVELAADGSGIIVRPAAAQGSKPASVLFDRASHKGKARSIDELQGLAVATRLGKAGRS